MSIFDEVESFYCNFNGEKGIIGKSFFGKPLHYFKVEKTAYPVVIVQCAIHAREHITAHLCLKLIDEYINTGNIGTIYFLPLINPDGVEIALLRKPLYKANGRGVDLNVNFDARWGGGEKNVRTINDENYIGEYPFSEPETIALRDFTLKILPNATLSYHCKGEEIYYEFHQSEEQRLRDLAVARAVQSATGYKIKSTPNSCGGYKDWCIEKLKIPALTIEVGDDNLLHPLNKDELLDIFNKNKRVLNVLTKTLMEIKCKQNL